jgi:DNA-binding PadR family transcriptional regulator
MSVRAPLSERPEYGLRLREEFEDRTGEVWPPNVGQVHTTLQKLERVRLAGSDGSAGEGPQKALRITSDREPNE